MILPFAAAPPKMRPSCAIRLSYMLLALCLLGPTLATLAPAPAAGEQGEFRWKRIVWVRLQADSARLSYVPAALTDELAVYEDVSEVPAPCAARLLSAASCRACSRIAHG